MARNINAFVEISFTHHILLLNKCRSIEERLFYMKVGANQRWSISALEFHIRSGLHKKQGKLPNNFKTALLKNVAARALDVFKDEYLFDFMCRDDGNDERVFEDKAVANIRKFIMRIGKGFSFIGNQYRVLVDGNEFFIDLLFYNRILRCLVVFELKRGKFKPEYAGQLNFYLNVLDDQLKLPPENPSIGIILCKEKSNTLVEYTFKTMQKAMGVATYRLSSKVPKEYKVAIPGADQLRKLV